MKIAKPIRLNPINFVINSNGIFISPSNGSENINTHPIVPVNNVVKNLTHCINSVLVSLLTII